MKKIDIERLSSDPASLQQKKRNSHIQMFWVINVLCALIFASFLVFSLQKATTILVVSSLFLVPMAFLTQCIVNQSISSPLTMLIDFGSMYQKGLMYLLNKE